MLRNPLHYINLGLSIGILYFAGNAVLKALDETTGFRESLIDYIDQNLRNENIQSS
jgi:hypothetical protein